MVGKPSLVSKENTNCPQVQEVEKWAFRAFMSCVILVGLFLLSLDLTPFPSALQPRFHSPSASQASDSSAKTHTTSNGLVYHSSGVD